MKIFQSAQYFSQNYRYVHFRDCPRLQLKNVIRRLVGGRTNDLGYLLCKTYSTHMFCDYPQMLIRFVHERLMIDGNVGAIAVAQLRDLIK